MSESTALVPTVIDEAMDFTVIATSPADMEAGQRSLILWAARKIQLVKKEVDEARAELNEAIDHKWKSSGWRTQLAKLERRIEFYRKIKMALEAGYYIVPPFPIDIFAIRTKRVSPRRMDSRNSDNHNQMAQILPPGEGRYVDPRPERSSYMTTEKQNDGTMKPVRYWYADSYQEPDFPFKLAKAEIRQATAAALKSGIFDELGVLPRTRNPDPFVCGRILFPDTPRYRFSEPKAVTFFVAWWLDTRTF